MTNTCPGDFVGLGTPRKCTSHELSKEDPAKHGKEPAQLELTSMLIFLAGRGPELS